MRVLRQQPGHQPGHEQAAAEVGRLLQRLAAFESPDLHKWIDRDLSGS